MSAPLPSRAPEPARQPSRDAPRRRIAGSRPFPFAVALSAALLAGPFAPTSAEPSPADVASPAEDVEAALVPARVEGLVRWAGSTPLRLKSFTNDVDVEACGRRVRSGAVQAGRRGALRHVLVEVLDVDGELLPGATLAPADEALEVSLGGCAVQPHVLVVPPGSQVAIANPDGILHELTAPALRNEPVRSRLPRFRRRLVLPPDHFRRPERIRISCGRHSWVGGWWVVTANAHHVLTGADGRFALDGIPPGTWTVRAWHGEFGAVDREVVLAAGEQRQVDFEFR